MQTPNIFLAYAPRGAGLRCALAYLSSERDVYGWFTGPRHDASVASCYFLLEDLFTARQARYDVVDAAALHASWSLDEARRHELARLQEMFAREWLFYRDDPHSAAELAAYQDAELAARDVNLRFERLAKLDKGQPNWTYYTPQFERTVLRHLAGRWPLEYRPHVDERSFAERQRPASGRFRS